MNEAGRLAGPLALACTTTISVASLQVINNQDSGLGSPRQAITDANLDFAGGYPSSQQENCGTHKLNRAGGDRWRQCYRHVCVDFRAKACSWSRPEPVEADVRLKDDRGCSASDRSGVYIAELPN